MKKLISIFLVLIILSVGVYAQTESEAILRVTGLGIMQGDKDGVFRANENITRAEFATIITRLKQIDDDSIMQQETIFKDVPKTHWASGYIAFATSAGIVNGMGDGLFMPENNIAYEEALKILVSLLGYNIMANERGGYPLGYISAAGNIGLLKSIKVSQGLLTRGDIATIVSNALDVSPLELKYGSDIYEKNQNTLYDLLIQKNKQIKVKGIVTQTKLTSLDTVVPNVDAGYIKIDNIKYKTALDFNNYIGYYVEGFAKLKTDEDIYEIINLAPVLNRNEKTTLDAEDVTIYIDYIELEKPDGEVDKTFFLPDAIYIYNGRRIIEPTQIEKQIFYGEYNLLDNTGDDKADIIFIQAAESFIVDKINTLNTTVYFANEDLYHGKNGFAFDYEEEDNQYFVVDTKGNTVKFEDIKQGNGITLMSSLDETYVRAVISTDTVSGKIDSISEDFTVGINGKEYMLAKNSTGTNGLNPSINDEALYVLDMYGKIIGISGVKKTDFIYGYIVDSATAKGLDSELEMRIISGTPPKKEVKVSSGKETISYYYQNDTIKILKTKSPVKYNDVRTNTNAINAQDLKGRIIGYKLDIEGKISEMKTFEIPSTFASHNFNAKIMAFGGEALSRGYFADAATNFVCLPKIADEDDDYYINLKLTDGSTSNKIYGIKAFPTEVSQNLTDEEAELVRNAEAVDILIIQAEMDASQPKTIQETDDVCIVGKISSSMGTIGDDVDSVVYKIELLNNTTKTTEVTKSSGKGFEEAKKLMKGDLIKVAKDGFGRIVNIQNIASVQGLTRYGETDNGGLYGLVWNVDLDTYDYLSNEKVDFVTLKFNEGSENKRFRIFKEDGQPIYMYERSSGWIYPATSDDIISYNQVGEGASKIYAQMDGNDATAIIIIKD